MQFRNPLNAWIRVTTLNFLMKNYCPLKHYLINNNCITNYKTSYILRDQEKHLT